MVKICTIDYISFYALPSNRRGFECCHNIHLANLSISYKQRKTFSFLEYFCFTEGNYTNFEILQQENKYID